MFLVQPATCQDVSPISHSNKTFQCPSNTEFNPAMATNLEPTAATCCKVGYLPAAAACVFLRLSRGIMGHHGCAGDAEEQLGIALLLEP